MEESGMGRPMGGEMEVNLTIKTAGNQFMNPESAVWFLNHLWGLMERREGAVVKIGVCRESKSMDVYPIYWVASTGGKLYGDFVTGETFGGFYNLEYATPECDSVESYVAAEKGGERTLWLGSRAICSAGLEHKGARIKEILVTKYNSDLLCGLEVDKAHFKGFHECYETTIEDIRTKLIEQSKWTNKFLAAAASLVIGRMFFCGGGGLVRAGKEWRYVISPRALTRKTYLRTDNGGEGDPILIWKRSETSTCVLGRVRLQIAFGDPLMSESAIRYRNGIFSAFLRIFESNSEDKLNLPLLRDPFSAMRVLSYDVFCREKVFLESGEEVSLPELFLKWLDVLLEFSAYEYSGITQEEQQILTDAHELVLGAQSEPEILGEDADWQIRREILSLYCAKKKIDFSHPEARRFEAHYGDFGPSGIFNLWQKQVLGIDPYSEEELSRTIWSHKAAPRAELRKQYLRELVSRQNPVLGFSHIWSHFFVGIGEIVSISDPLLQNAKESDLKRVERFLKE